MRKIKLLAVLISISSIANAQDPHFSLPYSAPLNLNPAFAGSAGVSRVCAGYRSQWGEINNGFRTTFFSYDQYINFFDGGIGINFVNDKTPDNIITTNNYDFIFSKNIPIASRKYVIVPALQSSFYSKRLDWDKLIWGTPPTPGYDSIQTRKFFDFTSGFLFYSKRIFGGMASHHLFEPDQGFTGTSKLPRKYTFHFGGNIGKMDSTKTVIVTPSVLILAQGSFVSTRANLAFTYNFISCGIGYRMSDAVIFSAGFINKFFRIAYSYDMTISELSNYTSGSHEMTASFYFNHSKKPEDRTFFLSSAF